MKNHLTPFQILPWIVLIFILIWTEYRGQSSFMTHKMGYQKSFWLEDGPCAVTKPTLL